MSCKILYRTSFNKKNVSCLNMTCPFKVDVWPTTLSSRCKHRYHHRCFISVCLFSLSHQANVINLAFWHLGGLCSLLEVNTPGHCQKYKNKKRCPALSLLQKMKLKHPRVTVEPLCHSQHSSAVHYVVYHLLWHDSCRNLGVSSSICPLITNVQL